MSLDDTYSCEEQIDSRHSVISVYSKGHSPAVFDFDLPKNKLAAIEVLLMDSCSSGLSCRDNGLFDIIKSEFGIEKSDYELSCTECDMGRGGYIKAKGTYKDTSPFELYYHWGWCSSGGADCGWSTCFTTASDNIFKSVKSNFCNKLSSVEKSPYISRVRPDGAAIQEVNITSDNTEKVKNSCLDGAFENTDGNKRTLSIQQISTRYGYSVEKSSFNCLGN